MLNTFRSTLAGFVGLAALVGAGEFAPAHAQVQNFGKVVFASGNSATFGLAFSQPGPYIGGGLGGSFSAIQSLNPATGTVRDFVGGFSVSGGPQQVTLTSTPGNAFMLTMTGAGPNGPGKQLGQSVPIKVTIVINLTGTPAPLPPGFPPGSTSRVATMIFKAVNATTGANIVTTGILKGTTVALP